jgi:hypothetical protein
LSQVLVEVLHHVLDIPVRVVNGDAVVFERLVKLVFEGAESAL